MALAARNLGDGKFDQHDVLEVRPRPNERNSSNKVSESWCFFCSNSFLGDGFIFLEYFYPTSGERMSQVILQLYPDKMEGNPDMFAEQRHEDHEGKTDKAMELRMSPKILWRRDLDLRNST